jgi:hypothetical protein
MRDIEEHGMIAAAMGWFGTIGGISAYLLLSRGWWQVTSLRYSGLNGVAGVLGASASAVYGAWPSVVSNLLWACIALHSAVVTLTARRSQRRLAPVVPLPVADHGPEPPTGPQPVLLHAA